MHLATGRPVRPIVAVNGSNDATSWRSHPLSGFVNKHIFAYFSPKNVKYCITPMVTLKSYNFGIVKDTYKLFAPNRGFSGSANLMVSFKITPNYPLPLVVMATDCLVLLNTKFPTTPLV